MTSRRLLAFACAALALAARPAPAGDTVLARVERALAAARTGEAPAEERASLEPLARDLEQQARAQRAEFDAAAARPLPPKARARLEATRQAWEAAQGRLPGLLRSGRVGGGPRPRRAPAGRVAAARPSARASSRRGSPTSGRRP